MKRTLPKLLTLKQAESETGIPQITLRSWIRSGGLKAVKIRGRVFLNESDFRRWLKVNTNNFNTSFGTGRSSPELARFSLKARA